MVFHGPIPHCHRKGVQVTFIKTAKCGHNYVSPGPRGRERFTGDCECSAKPKVATLDLTCIRCGTEFHHSRHREYCTDSCRVSIQRRRKSGQSIADVELLCERCGDTFEAVRNTAKRCLPCQGKVHPIFPEQVCVNPHCGISFVPFKAGQQSCGNSCAQKVWKAANRRPEPWDDRRRANYQKRRALKRLLPAENVIAREVFERDGWMCGICLAPVDESLVWPDPFSPSLDHVVPLARGGHHTYQNTQLAHLRCNVSKGDRVDAVAM